MQPSYHITQQRTLSDQHGKLESISYTLTSEKGEVTNHEAEVYNAGDAVAILLYNRATRKVHLLSQFRIASARNGNETGMLTEVCAGKIEDLSAEKTARKEVLEETGYELDALKPVMTIFMSPGAFTEKLHFFAASYETAKKRSSGGGRKDEGEDIRIREVPFDEALAMISDGRIVDAKTIILLQYAAINGLM